MRLCRTIARVGVVPAIVGSLLLMAAPVDAQTPRKATRADVERLVSIALVTEWVIRECGAEGLSGMLLATMPSVLKQLTPEAHAEGRRRVEARATSYKSKEAACRVMKGRLVEVQ